MKPRERTHWTDCWRDHHECAVAEVERLRADLAAAKKLLKWLYEGVQPYKMTGAFSHEPINHIIVNGYVVGQIRLFLLPKDAP